MPPSQSAPHLTDVKHTSTPQGYGKACEIEGNTERERERSRGSDREKVKETDGETEAL